MKEVVEGGAPATPEARRQGRRHLAHPPPLIRVNHETIVFATACVKGRRGLLHRPEIHDVIQEAWRQADQWLVGRYVLMPDHVHFFCSPVRLEASLKAWMSFWRNMATRAWPYADEKPIWQRDYWDTQLRRGENYGAKWQYVRQNPVRAQLVAGADEWPYQGEMNRLTWTSQ